MTGRALVEARRCADTDIWQVLSVSPAFSTKPAVQVAGLT
jgi:hypothetical protein